MAPSSKNTKNMPSMDDKATAKANDAVEELPTPLALTQSSTDPRDISNPNATVALSSDYQEVVPSTGDKIATRGHNILTELPWELWLTVSSFLPPSTARNFALSCCNTFNLMGQDTKTALQRPENYRERLRFLEAQDVHFPDHLLCLDCGIYHQRRDTAAIHYDIPYAIHQLSNRSTPAPVRYPGSLHQGCPADAEGAVTFRLMPRDVFNWTTLHLIAREARLGAEYGQGSIKSVMFAHIRSRIYDAPWRHVREIRVIEGKVIAKVQSFCAVDDVTLILASRHNLSHHSFASCQHRPISFAIRERCRTELARLRSQRIPQLSYQPEPEPWFKSACHSCPTEWAISTIPLSELRPKPLMNFAQAGHIATEVIRVTRWINFGECKASDPDNWDRLTPSRAGHTNPWGRRDNSPTMPVIMEAWPEHDNSERFEVYHHDSKSCEVYVPEMESLSYRGVQVESFLY
ncbi:hypothetical protein EG328_009184 [Venturia inaequalis]|uniref:F-box domain-containing protein n=1 Tax=Venturia inaequalis TaxID=5025 RepID=A0A8H3UAH1_VENIN|nr:hypothetical protein EG328_009184 [Venturia inaequalis]RDI82041.1 hypothetical protein Vi05172_g7999 [Venturia inaequalis]